MLTTALNSLSDAIAGRVALPGGPGYDDARHGFNLAVDHRPAAVAFPRDEQDVKAVVRFARRHGLAVAPQSTGHNQGPLGSLDGTILLNMCEHGGVAIDAAARRVRAGAATRWKQVTPQLSELGLAALHGSSPEVGIVGYSLGGGMGWLARAYGLQANSVTAIELVNADGELVRTDAENEPDLFWALRGGGGNFGVVTALEFTVYAVSDLYAGVLFYPLERAAEVLHAWRELLPKLPEELTSWAELMRFPDLPDVPALLRGGSFVQVSAAFVGTEADGRDLLKPLRDLDAAMDTFEAIAPIGLAGIAMDPVDPLPFRSAHALLGDLPASAIDDLVEAAGSESGSPLDLVGLAHTGGALARAEPGAGSRSTLPGSTCLFALGALDDADSAGAVEASLEAVEAALRPYRVGEYPSFVEEPADAARFFDVETWTRLRELKRRYDPDDLFRGNHHVPPSS